LGIKQPHFSTSQVGMLQHLIVDGLNTGSILA